MAAIHLYALIAFVVWECLFRDQAAAEYNLCPSACSCLGDYVDCSRLGLIEVPKDLPSWVTNLELQSNGISALHEDDFKGLNRLEFVDLSNNEIETINETIFQGLPMLKELKINSNKLTEIPILKDNPSLTLLELKDNNIHSINATSLSHATQLESLDLSHNEIMDIPIASFPKNLTLKKLTLSSNKISIVEAGCFNNLTTLESLKLNKNKIAILPNEFLSNLKNLKSLDLAKNQLRKIELLPFKGLDNLTQLKLRRNFIRELSSGVFWGLGKILNLQLDQNNMTEIQKRWLYGLGNLKHLSVSGNKINHIDSEGWEFCEQLQTLDLADNHLTTVGMTTFSKLKKLRMLHLSKNRIEVIEDKAFQHLPNLEELTLDNNQISWTIEDTNGAFVGLEKLKMLSLEKNHIKTITKQAFMGLSNLEKLQLRNNNITAIQGNAFEAMRNLRELEFNSSSFFCDCQLAWLPIWLRDNNYERTVLAKCSNPDSLKGQSIFTVDSNDFKCEGSFPRPVIVKSPVSQMLLKGENITLNCTAASTESQGSPTQFQWKKDNLLIVDGNIENHANRSGNLTHYISRIQIRNAQDKDAGRYQCIISNDYGSAYSKKASISVHVFPAFTKTPEDVTVKVGSSAKLVCAASGQPPPVIGWQKDGGEDNFPAAEERRMQVMPDDDTFFIMEVKSVDEGVYSCTAKNDAGTVVANATLTVLETPSFVQPMEPKYTKAGETTVIECRAAGNPQPKLKWLKDGEGLQVTDRHFFTAEDQLLVIVQTKPSDEGIYTCEMSNTLGTERGDSKLTVINIPNGNGGGDVGQSQGRGGDGGLDDESTTTGIIIIAVVCCVVGTSLVWVIIIYQTRKRQELYSATPTDETTLPGEVPSSGYTSSDKEGSFSQTVPITAVPGYQYQMDMQMKESGYESSSGRFRAARTAAIFPSDVEHEEQAHYALLGNENQYPDHSDENSDSGQLYTGSETDSIHSNSEDSSHSGVQPQTLETFHPQPTNHDRFAPSPYVQGHQSGEGEDIHTHNNIQCENNLESISNTPPLPTTAESSDENDVLCNNCNESPSDRDAINFNVKCRKCQRCEHSRKESNNKNSGRHNSPPTIPPKPARSRRGRHKEHSQFDSSQPPGANTVSPGAKSQDSHGTDSESSGEGGPPPVMACASMYPPMYMPHSRSPNHGQGYVNQDPACMSTVPVSASGTQYIPLYPNLPVNTPPCDCHLHYGISGPPYMGHDNQRTQHKDSNVGSQRMNGVMGCVHHMMAPQWQHHHGHPPPTYPYMHHSPPLPQVQALQQQQQQSQPAECVNNSSVNSGHERMVDV